MTIGCLGWSGKSISLDMATYSTLAGVRSYPESDRNSDLPGGRYVPIPTKVQCSKLSSYSITSSAVASSLSGTVRPSAFAVLKLMTNWYLVGNCTGRFAGFSPLRMRSM